MGPLPHADGHHASWLINKVVRGEATVLDDVVAGFESPVGGPVFTHELPDVLEGVRPETHYVVHQMRVQTSLTAARWS